MYFKGTLKNHVTLKNVTPSLQTNLGGPVDSLSDVVPVVVGSEVLRTDAVGAGLAPDDFSCMFLHVLVPTGSNPILTSVLETCVICEFLSKFYAYFYKRQYCES